MLMQSIKVFQESQNVLVFDGRKSREKRSFKIDDAIGKSSLNGIFEAECHVRSFSNFNSWSHLHTYMEHVEENWTGHVNMYIFLEQNGPCCFLGKAKNFLFCYVIAAPALKKCSEVRGLVRKFC